MVSGVCGCVFTGHPLSHFEEGTLSSSLHLQAVSSYPGNSQAGILYKHL